MEMERIDYLIENPGIYYDSDKVEGWVSFCENEMCLTDGQDLKLLDSFKLWGEQVFGWYYFETKSVYVPNKNRHGGHYENRTVKFRLIKKQYLIVGRGAAKSLYSSMIQAYGLTVDSETTFQIAVAPTMSQAEEITTPIQTAIIRAKGPLFKFLTDGSLQNTTGNRLNRMKLASTKKGIENFLTNSKIVIKPMAIQKLQGLRPKYSSVDEWLSCDIREDPIGAIEQGASKLDDYVIIATSSEGTIRNGIGDSMKIELLDILKGDYPNIHVSIFYYKLDSVEEIADPDMWLKANPNIGSTVSWGAYQADVERAERVPSAKHDILAKRFNLPMEGFTYFFRYEETLCHPKREYWGMQASMGVDLSRGDDFCAFTFLFPLRDEAFGVKTRAYITELTLMKLPPALRAKYEDFIDEGSLIVMPGTVLELDDVYDDLQKHIYDSDYTISSVGYDPYNAKEFMTRWEMEYGPFAVEKIIQGAKTESVPLGELKKMAEEDLLDFDQEIMSFTMGNCVVIEDTNGNRKLMKIRNDQKIDSVAAMMDAYVAYKLHKDAYDLLAG